MYQIMPSNVNIFFNENKKPLLFKFLKSLKKYLASKGWAEARAQAIKDVNINALRYSLDKVLIKLVMSLPVFSGCSRGNICPPGTFTKLMCLLSLMKRLKLWRGNILLLSP